jgi:hypothetical protein
VDYARVGYHAPSNAELRSRCGFYPQRGGAADLTGPRGVARHLLVHLDEGELRRSVEGNDEVDLALRSSNLGEVDMQVADRISSTPNRALRPPNRSERKSARLIFCPRPS